MGVDQKQEVTNEDISDFYNEETNEVTSPVNNDSVDTDSAQIGSGAGKTVWVGNLATGGDGSDANPWQVASADMYALPEDSVVIFTGVTEITDCPVTHDKQIAWQGLGQHYSIVKKPDGTDADFGHITDKIEFRDIQFDFNKSGQSTGVHGWVLKQNTTNSHLRRVSTIHAGGDGSSGDNWRFEDRAYAWEIWGLYSELADGYGTHVVGSGKIDECHYVGGYEFDNGSGGLFVESGSGGILDTTYHGTIWNTNSGNGVEILSGNDPTFEDCAFTDSGVDGLITGGSVSNVTVDGGFSGGNQERGARLEGDECTITGGFVSRDDSAGGSHNVIEIKGFDSTINSATVDAPNTSPSNAFVVGGSNCRAIDARDVSNIGSFVSSGCSLNGIATESASAESPQESYPAGTLVRFTDSGDGSGTGTYLQNNDGTFTQLSSNA